MPVRIFAANVEPPFNILLFNSMLLLLRTSLRAANGTGSIKPALIESFR